MNIVFAGTPDIAATCLQVLLESEHNIVAVYTQPDRPKGRGKKLLPSPVKALAQEHGIPVQQPENLKADNAVATLQEFNPDVMIVVAYGLILPEAILQTPKYGCINVHTSLLPKYRGPAPVQHAILQGDGQTGVTIMQMDADLDTGAILQQEICDINNNDTTETLLAKLADIGSNALLNTLTQLPNIKAISQDDSLASYAGKINKHDALIDWKKPAEQIAREIRAFQPWPVAYSYLDEHRIRFLDGKPFAEGGRVPGEILNITEDSIDIACGSGLLRVTTMQLPGKTAMPVQAIINGHPELFAPGMCFHGNA